MHVSFVYIGQCACVPVVYSFMCTDFPPPLPAGTHAYVQSPPHHCKTNEHDHKLHRSHFSSHLIDKQNERHDIIDRNAQWPRERVRVKTDRNRFKVGHVKT